MTIAEEGVTAAADERGASGWRWMSLNYALTILASAFLLFQVQPLISKSILPWFGGGPAVWSTCMMFFQVVLFAGYLYAHVISRWLPPLWQAAVHTVLLAGAIVALPIAPSAALKPPDSAYPVLRIVVILATSVGLPYFVLASTGPLIQAWFSRSFPGRSPYRLYALSNVGSLLALVTYPFYFEPLFGLSQQQRMWSWLFVAFAVLCWVCALVAWRAREQAPLAAASNADASWATPIWPPTWRERAAWMLLPGWASMMLLATTNHLCQDIATVPFLWVAPLSVYLLTFIIAFDHPRWYWRRGFAVACALLVLLLAGIDRLVLLATESDQNFDIFQQLALYLTTLFCACMVCHGELVRLRPAPRYLTEFYLLIAAGGALGGIFVGIVAPLVFRSYMEWRIGLAGAFVLAIVALAATSRRRVRRRIGFRLRFGAIAVAGVIIIFLLLRTAPGRLLMDRNFYGVVYVERAIPKVREHGQLHLMNGRILHGAEFLEDTLRGEPTTYYAPISGVGRAVKYLARRGKIRIGAVGLGAGTMAAHCRKGDYIRFYEINPLVPMIAKKYFHFLGTSPGDYEIVMGDARVSLEREIDQHQPQRFDLLVLDAFSSDAIPTHLLTKEAFATYLKHLNKDGIIAVHITNRYLRLAPVVDGLAKYYGLLSTQLDNEGDTPKLYFSSDWVLVTRDKEFVEKNPPVYSEKPLETKVRLWTDDFSNLFQILR